MTILADTPPRSRKRARPSFDAPSDVTAPAESGWVFRSDAPADATSRVEPAPVATPEVAPPARIAAAPAPPPPASAPAEAPAPVVLAPVVGSESPLRFAWVPLAIGYSTILAMLPRRHKGGGRP